MLVIAQLMGRILVSLAQRGHGQNTEDTIRVLGKERVFAALAQEMGAIGLAAAIGALFVTCSAG